tara:strand:+ start:191 stop:790 length:600 start_codon:yes stop_codon:yes gene_type:complete
MKWSSLVRNNYDQVVPIYPKNNTDGLKVHLGSGEINLQGWINVDARKFKHTHFVSQGFNLDKFKDSTLSEVYFCHVLEHFSFNDSNKLINQIYNILEPEGLIRISVPDVEKLIELYKNQKKLDVIKKAIMGGQNYPNDFHKSIYDFKELKNLLEKNNFKDIKTWDTETVFGQSIGDWSDGFYKFGGKKYNISLNLVAKK